MTTIIQFLSPEKASPADGDGGVGPNAPAHSIAAASHGGSSPARPPSWRFLPDNEFSSVLPGQKSPGGGLSSFPSIPTAARAEILTDDIPPFLRRGDPACAVKPRENT